MVSWLKSGVYSERNECFQRNHNLFGDGGLRAYFKISRGHDLQCHPRIFIRGDRLTGWVRIRIVQPPVVVVAPEASVCPMAEIKIFSPGKKVTRTSKVSVLKGLPVLL